MTIKKFREIFEYISEIVKDSPFSGNVYIVGGAVRDFVMGNDIKDIDICVSMPNGGIDFANYLHKKKLLVRTPIIYPTYGTAMLKFKKYNQDEIECVHTRGEQYHDKNSRNPETYYASIEEDAFRRDLTINSLYYDLTTNEIIDPTHNGLYDIRHNIIRVTNDNPDIVFNDDPLRLMRCVRFTSRFGWDIDETTYDSMKRNAERLKIISKERIQDEFVKILLSKNPVMGMVLLKETGLLEQFIPEFKETYGMKQNIYHDYCTVWEHTMKVIQHASEIEIEDKKLREFLMLGAVFHDIGKIRTYTEKEGKVHFYNHEYESEKMTRDILKRLKFPNDTIDEVCFMVRNHMRFKGVGDNTPKDKSIRKFQYECVTEDRFNLCIYLIHADNLSHGAKYCLPNQAMKILERSDELLDDGNSMFNYKLPISGDEIMEFKGINPGPEVKKYKEYLLKMAFNNAKELDRDMCFKYIKNLDISKI
jgi:putative nucleotidyltransferase with HDIG domain